MLCPSCGNTDAKKLPPIKFEEGEKFQVQCSKCNFLIKDFDGINWTLNFAQMIARNLAELYRQSDVGKLERAFHNPFSKLRPNSAPLFKFEHVQVGNQKVERQSLGVFHATEDRKFLPPVPTPPRFAQYRDYWIDLETLEKFLEKHFLEGL